MEKPERLIRAQALVSYLEQQVAVQEGFVANERAKLLSLQRELEFYQNIIKEYTR